MARPEKLAGALSRALKGLDVEARMREATAMALWSEIVGEVTAAKSHPLHVNRGTMVVAVASSAWANQLNLLKPKLLSAIEARLGPGVIRDLRWRTGPHETEAPTPEFVRPPRPVSPLRLSAPQIAAIAAQAAEIADGPLASRLERVLRARAERQERLRQSGWVPCRACGVLCDTDPRADGLCPPCRFGGAPG
ncbi:MAG TPA: DUF721 domain-containing protein [Oscillatoriaceae cyanobacterium]